MTHLSDFSYLERAVLDVYISAYLLYSIYKNDKFKCLHPSKVLAGELRSIITYIMITMMTTQAIWDYFGVYIKYTEGFMMLPNGQIITKPYPYWSPENQRPVQPMDYLQCVTFAMQTGVFCLMQCFWNYLSNSVAKRSFMGSLEFKFYIFWALGSVAMFVVLQWHFINKGDELMSEIAPQLAYGCEVLLTAILGVRSDFRFKRIIAYSQRKDSANRSIVSRLSYFKQMNVMLTTVLFLYGASFVILCVDGFTDSMTINTNKFACDLLIANINMCVVCLWLLFISIFHPRRNFAGPAQTSLATQTGQETEYISKNDVEMTNSPRTTRPLSERITQFMHYGGGSEKHQQQQQPPTMQTMPHTIDERPQNSVFMRPMSPVNVDYPPSYVTDTAPLTTSAAATPASGMGRNVSIEDPYSSQSVLFSMVEPKQSRYPTPDGSSYQRHQEVAVASSNYDQHSEYGVDVSQYHDDTSSGYNDRPLSPPYAEGNAMTAPAATAAAPGRERMVTDWLKQSPGRK